jgi:predicted component of type VI protein secretion system
VLKKEEVPPCLLGDPRKKTGARLGWTSWLTTAPLPRDADDVVFESPV